MIALLVTSLVIGLVGVLIAVAVRITESRIPSGRVIADRAAIADDLDVALLAGGVIRAVDAQIADLRARGLVLASDDGVLSVEPDVEPYLTMPVDSPSWKPGFDVDDAVLLVEIRRDGPGGLDAVRRGAVMWRARRRIAALQRAGLLVSPTRRVYEGLLLVLPVLLSMFLCSVVMMVQPGTEGSELLISISIIAWVPIALLIGVILTGRTGYHGASPVSATGVAVLEALRAERSTSPGRCVALGGNTALLSCGMPRAVLEGAGESFWDVRRRIWRKGSTEVNAVAARRFGLVAADTPNLGGVTLS